MYSNEKQTYWLEFKIYLCVIHIYGEGNGNPLQYSCLENPMDGGAWWATVHGVPRSWTRLSEFTFTFHFSLSYIGEGNGNPLQCSCMENPRDGGAWWAAIYGVAQSRTQLKRLSSSSSSSNPFDNHCWMPLGNHKLRIHFILHFRPVIMGFLVRFFFFFFAVSFCFVYKTIRECLSGHLSVLAYAVKLL